MPRFFISAAETSADQHGAALIQAVRSLRKDVEFAGVAGPAMRQAGCRTLFDLSQHSSMLLGAVSQIGRGWKLLRAVAAHLRRNSYDAVIVIDSPLLHLPMARAAKRAGFPVLYYVAPQLWAWGRWRTRKLRRRADRLAVILPFEEAFFRDRGFQVDFVGHPLLDRLEAQSIDAELVSRIRGRGSPVVALLPGSRGHVVDEVLPGQLEVAAQITAHFPKCHVRVSVAHDRLSEGILRQIAKCGSRAVVHEGPLSALLSAADLALVASGTATLEVAYYEAPMVVMYNGSKWFYRLVGRHLLHIQHLSLVNILAGRELVPEFMPYYDSTVPISERAIRLLESKEQMEEIRRGLREVISSLKGPGASHRAAEILLAMCNSAMHSDE